MLMSLTTNNDRTGQQLVARVFAHVHLSSQENDVEITKHKVVTIQYILTSDQQIVQETTEDDPFTFLFGVGETLPSFEAQLENKVKGDKVSFALTAEEAYGERVDEMVQEVDMEAFQGAPEGALEVGKILPMQMVDPNTHLSQTVFGTILEINTEFVKMDFNHPLAGQPLEYEVEILDVRDATPSEIDHGHVH